MADRHLQSVKISTRESLKAFLRVVPSSYYQYILELDVCTKSRLAIVGHLESQCDAGHHITQMLENIIAKTHRLSRLSLSIGGSLESSVIPIFANLARLQIFSLANWADEEVAPM